VSVRWREELFRPQDFLHEDTRLIKTIENLSQDYRLAAVTNNPSAVGRAALRCLGIEPFFPLVVGLDSCLASKPDPAPYRYAVNTMQLAPGHIVNVGDRYEIDIEPVLGLGMGGILVESLDDVYSLDEYFSIRYKG
jgi:phosphoglycolate phosphatase/putative hydrolase of the HAD superfamily